MSGAQTGVDRAALDVALALGLPIAGWVPRGRKAEDGVVPRQYDALRECHSGNYAVRTRLNVRDADATLIFTSGAPHGGTRLTMRIAAAMSKPLLIIDALYHDEAESARRVASWLDSLPIARLNIAGPRASQLPTLYDYTRAVLERALTR